MGRTPRRVEIAPLTVGMNMTCSALSARASLVPWELKTNKRIKDDRRRRQRADQVLRREEPEGDRDKQGQKRQKSWEREARGARDANKAREESIPLTA
jgi:hypothetical protein